MLYTTIRFEVCGINIHEQGLGIRGGILAGGANKGKGRGNALTAGFSPSSGLLVVIRPPLPWPPRFLEGKKLKHPNEPMLPAGLPGYRAPMPCAASSMTGKRWVCAIPPILFISAGKPKR